MPEFLLLMHNDVEVDTPGDWGAYLSALKQSGHFGGGSSIGRGLSLKKGAAAESVSHWLGGYIVVHAKDLAEARSLAEGNPVLVRGGTVEVRELPRD